MAVEKLSFDALAGRYCERQASTPADLLGTLKGQQQRYLCDGFFLAECHDMSSSWMGSLVILPYGPNNSFKTVPSGDKPFSPRGLASDMSVAVAYCLASELPEEAAPWVPPAPPPERRKRRK
jgi:hypothetical protein